MADSRIGIRPEQLHGTECGLYLTWMDAIMLLEALIDLLD